MTKVTIVRTENEVQVTFRTDETGSDLQYLTTAAFLRLCTGKVSVEETGTKVKIVRTENDVYIVLRSDGTELGFRYGTLAAALRFCEREGYSLE